MVFDVFLVPWNWEILFGLHGGKIVHKVISFFFENLIDVKMIYILLGSNYFHLSFSILVDEVILEYIIERKRMDDLAESIIDGRFKEQKVDDTHP
jgi:hypothetical protein